MSSQRDQTCQVAAGLARKSFACHGLQQRIDHWPMIGGRSESVGGQFGAVVALPGSNVEP